MPRNGGRPGAGADEDRVEAHLAASAAATEKVLPITLLVSNFTPSVLEGLDLAADDLARQAERRDAVLQHAADHVQRLVDRDVAAVAGEVGSDRQPRGAGADDRRRCRAVARSAAAGVLRGRALSPTKRSSRPIATDSSLRPTTHCASHCDSCGQTRPQTDGNRLVSLITASAPSRSRTSDVPDEARDVDRDRAACDAGRPSSTDAALGLGQRVGHRVAEVDFLEVARALQRVALGHLRRVRREVLVLLVVVLVLLEQHLLDVADVRVVGRSPSASSPLKRFCRSISSLKST